MNLATGPRPLGGVRCSFGKPDNRARANTLGAAGIWPPRNNWNRGLSLAFSSLGFSLPDLTITGQAGPRAAWGGVLEVSAILQNIGASTITEPLSQAPATTAPTPGSPYGSTSTADAPETTVTVLLSRSARSTRARSRWEQSRPRRFHRTAWNSSSIRSRCRRDPKGFAAAGGKFFVWFLANSSNSTSEVSHSNNLSTPVAVQVTSQPLPVRAIALALPASLSPGDTVKPQIQIENLGSADSSLQGPVTVYLVASVTRNFTLGSSIVASYTVDSVPAVSETPTAGNFKTFAKHIINQPNNVVTITGSAVTLPASPRKYFLGVVVDPNGSISQLSVPENNFALIRVVGPKAKHLPPAGVVSSPNTGQFPNPASGTPIGVT